jgi:DNA-binding NarL/FixJ family response regulator
MTSTTDDPIRVVLVEDHTVVRQALRSLLSAFEQVDVVGEAGRPSEALGVVRAARPDVVLLDLRLGDEDGLATARACKEEVPDCRVLMLSGHGSSEQLRSAMAAGADGYLLKGVTGAELVEGLRRTVRGETVIDHEFVPTLLEAAIQGRGRPMDELTLREQEVLALVADGLTSGEVGARLGITVRTIQKHLENMHRKFGVSSRAELIREAFRRGVLQ